MYVGVMNLKNKKEKNALPFFSGKDMETGDMRLFPDEFMANAASATECTGLIQVPLEDEEDADIFEDIYSFKMSEPILEEDN